GLHDKAEELHQTALARRKRVLGDEHPDTPTSESRLMEGGRGAGGVTHGDEKKRVFGEEYSDTPTSMNNLATMLDGQGKYEAAESILKQTLLGEKHPDTLVSMNDLAQLLGHRHRYDESTTAYQGAYAVYIAVLGKDHLNT
ncbi:hypothetical protein DM02DRAFT_469765, partial [Periconia macrospinosa]